jgi:hypothetical protein
MSWLICGHVKTDQKTKNDDNIDALLAKAADIMSNPDAYLPQEELVAA